MVRLPKIALLCGGTVHCMSTCTASCQEAWAPPRQQRIDERKAIARVEVHKLLFVLRLSLRAVVLMLKFGPLLLFLPLTLVSERWASRWLDGLLWVTETSGPTFIKLGQWASTRRDIFSRAFCDRFCRLHVHVRPHSWEHTMQCLRRAFGEHWRQLFLFDCTEPVGSGCIAQVYRARARVQAVEDPAFHQLVEDLEREDLLEAWEIPGLGGPLHSLQDMVTGEKEESLPQQTGKTKSADLKSQDEAPVKDHLIPVAIKVGKTLIMHLINIVDSMCSESFSSGQALLSQWKHTIM